MCKNHEFENLLREIRHVGDEKGKLYFALLYYLKSEVKTALNLLPEGAVKRILLDSVLKVDSWESGDHF